MGKYSGWEIVDKSPNVTSTAPQSIGKYSGWEEVKQPEQAVPQESFMQALGNAPGRIYEDVTNAGMNLYNKIPDYYESAKTEVPALVRLLGKTVIGRLPPHAAMQALAGINEGINSAAQAPLDISKYGSERLHLLPQSVTNAINYVTPQDTTKDINNLFGQPVEPGEAILRGLIRNSPNILTLSSLSKSLAGKLLPEKSFNPEFKFSANTEIPSNASQFTNIPYQEPYFLKKIPEGTSENIAKNLNSDIIGNKTIGEKSKSLANEIKNKYSELKNYYTDEYNNLFNRNSGIQSIQTDEKIPVKDVLLKNSDYIKKYQDYDFPDKNLNDLNNILLNNKSIKNLHDLQSELGSEIGYLKKQKSNNILDSSGKNRLRDYANMRESLKNDLYNNLNNIDPSYGDEYLNTTKNWQEHIIPFHSDKNLREIAEGNIKNPKSSDLINIFRNPEENINSVTSKLSNNAKNNIISLASGKNNFQNSVNDMLSARNNIYNNGIEDYLQPHHEESFNNLLNSKIADEIANSINNKNSILSKNLRKIHERAMADSISKSEKAKKSYESANDEVMKMIKNKMSEFDIQSKSGILKYFPIPKREFIKNALLKVANNF